MEKTRKLSFSAALKMLNTADFYRNLVSVIIGIVITFGGSSMLQRCSGRRETARIMSMVRDELEINRASVELQKKRLLFEYAAAVAIRPYMDVPESIPADTLDKYKSALINTFYLQIATNSLEVLKNSGQTHNSLDHELIREIFEVYDLMQTGAVQVRMEYKDKDESRESRDMEAWYGGDDYAQFAQLMKDNAMRNYIIATVNQESYWLIYAAAELIARIDRVTGMINRDGTRKQRHQMTK